MRAFGRGWWVVCGLLSVGGLFLGAQERPPVLVSSVEALLNGNHAEIPFLLKHREEALRVLARSVQSRSIPLDQLLQRLGAEEYGVREEATMQLIRMGKTIHPQVKAQREAMIDDPEVVYRCDLVLEAQERLPTPVEDLAVIRFLLELANPTPEELLPFSECFHRVMTSQTLGIFEEKEQGAGHRPTLKFLHLWANLPEGQEAILAWLDGAKFSDAEILADGAKPLKLHLLFDPEFAGKLDRSRRGMLSTLQSKVFKNKQHHRDLIQQVQHPEAAWMLLRMTDDYTLQPDSYDQLFKHLEQMPNEVFLEYVQPDAPMALGLIRELVKRREKLREPLAALLRETLLGTRFRGNVGETFHVARDVFGIEFAEGELDRAWQLSLEDIHSRSAEFTPERMGWMLGNTFRLAGAMKISPTLVLRHLQDDGAMIVQRKDSHHLRDSLIWLLGAPQSHIRQATLEWIAQNIPEEGYGFDSLNFMRSALFLHVSDDTIPPELRLKAFARLQPKEIESVFRGLLGFSYSSEYCRNLLHFFNANEKMLRSELADESMGLAYVDLLFPLWRHPSLKPRQRTFLEQQLRRILPDLRKDPRRNTVAVLISEMMRLDDPEADAFLLDMLQTKPASTFSIDTLNIPNQRHARILPDLLKRASTADDAGRRMFQAAMMIDPDHPELRTCQEQILAGEASPEDLTALFDVLFRLSREPRLSEVPPERLSQWFATDSRDAMKHTLQRLAFFRDSENRRTLLRFFRPALPLILASDAELQSFMLLYKHPYRNREEDIEALAELLRSDSATVQKNAAETLCFMDQLPETLAAPLLETLQQQLSNTHRSTLLWALALTGRHVPDLAEGLAYSKDREAFCLANIHPSPAERERQLRRLMEDFMQDPEWWTLKQIRLTRGFPGIIQPFMDDILHRALYSTAKDDQRFYFGSAAESIRWIPDALPEAEALALLKRLLQDAADLDSSLKFRQEVTDTVINVLEIRYPGHLVDFEALLKKLPFQCQITTEYRRITARIAQQKGQIESTPQLPRL